MRRCAALVAMGAVTLIACSGGSDAHADASSSSPRAASSSSVSPTTTTTTAPSTTTELPTEPPTEPPTTEAATTTSLIGDPNTEPYGPPRGSCPYADAPSLAPRDPSTTIDPAKPDLLTFTSQIAESAVIEFRGAQWPIAAGDTITESVVPSAAEDEIDLWPQSDPSSIHRLSMGTWSGSQSFTVRPAAPGACDAERRTFRYFLHYEGGTSP